MGAKHSHQQTGVEKKTSQLDKKINAALNSIRKTMKQQGKLSSDPFNRIMLKFPKIGAAFNSARDTFNAFDTEKKGYISYKDLKEAITRLGASFTSEEVNELFQESDFNSDGELSLKEFLVCLAIGFVLHKIPSLDDGKTSIFYGTLPDAASPKSRGSCLFGQGNNLRDAFGMAIEAFLWFDITGDCLIEKAEMEKRMQASMHLYSPTKKTALKAKQNIEDQLSHSGNVMLSEGRFLEMDWDKDGEITFKEFLMAFESWVGVDENYDEPLYSDDDLNDQVLKSAMIAADSKP